MQAETKQQPQRPGIGVAVLVWDTVSKKLLASRRKDNKLIAFPGGHLEKYESWEETGSRELKEECALEVAASEMKLVGVFNVICQEKNYHYVTFAVICKYPADQKIVNLEPEKHDDWEWVSIEEIKALKNEEKFYTITYMIEQLGEKFGAEYFDSLFK